MSTPLVEKVLGHALRIVAEEAKASRNPLALKAGEHLGECGCAGCGNFTLGGVCSQCSRHACTRHLFMSVSLPPQATCAECIATEFEVVRGPGPKRPKVEVIP